MFQKPKTIAVTVATSGTPVRVISDPQSEYRYARSAYFKADNDNTNGVALGDADVEPTGPYADRLEPNESVNMVADEIHSGKRDMIDLYNVWVDADTNGNIVYVTISVTASPGTEFKRKML